MSEERGLHDICLAMGRHNTDVELVEAACSALWSLSMEGKMFTRHIQSTAWSLAHAKLHLFSLRINPKFISEASFKISKIYT